MTTFTDRALSAQIITEDEADALENWIEDNCHKERVTVPSNLHALWERVALFNFEGDRQ